MDSNKIDQKEDEVVIAYLQSAWLFVLHMCAEFGLYAIDEKFRPPVIFMGGELSFFTGYFIDFYKKVLHNELHPSIKHRETTGPNANW